MAAILLLSAAKCDTVGAEAVLRIIGTRNPPTHMVVQIAIKGSANLQLQGRIARDAPWQDLGPQHGAGALVHLKAIQFLRAVATSVTPGSEVSVWADWGW